MNVNITADVSGVLASLDRLDRNVQRAEVAALNRVGTSARAEVVREISQQSGLKQKDLREHIPLSRATKARPFVEIVAKPWSPNLIRYQARQVKQGVTAKAWGNRKLYKGAFIGNQGRTVFARTSKARLPIKALHGPSVPKEFVKGYALRALEAKVHERFGIEFNRALAQFNRQ